MSQSLEIDPIKGRPMLYWVGKKPLNEVKGFPVQLDEGFNTQNPPKYPTWTTLKKNWVNLLFHGDNKEILSTLLMNGFRGKIDLVYIDPPFNTGTIAYLKKVTLRGQKHNIFTNENSTMEDIQYNNFYIPDIYLQNIYERLILIKELMANHASLFCRTDYHYSHYIKILLDEIFGKEFFRNEIIVSRTKTLKGETEKFHHATDSILFYAKNKNLFNGWKNLLPKSEWSWKDMHMVGERKNKKLLTVKILKKFFTAPPGRRWMLSQEAITNAEKQGLIKIDTKSNMPKFLNKYHSPGSNWLDIRGYSKTHNYPTENSESILERTIECASKKNSIVLDCFCGSGTTAAVAEKFGRRWIAADMNKGAIQTTVKRLMSIENCQSFAQYRVNNYDFRAQNGLRESIIQHYGVELSRSDLFFDGTANGRLVKIVSLNRPLSPLDVQAVKKELQNRPEETRDITLIGNGSESTTREKVQQDNRLATINKVYLTDIQRDGIMLYSPAKAVVRFERKDTIMRVVIEDYCSPTILKKLGIDSTVFDEDIKDFKAQIDYILIDSDYNKKEFRVTESDIPESKKDFVKAEYNISLPHAKACVAVKIVDMLGEEVLEYSQ